MAVDALGLRIRPGSYVCLLGPSGCGKTTTLRLLAGHENPTSGDILLDDLPIVGLPPARRGTAMMFQSYALFPHLSVLDNVAFSLRMRGVGKAERHAKAADALKLVELDAYAARLPAQLSGGQQQRVALARALVTNPATLLLDEPLSALDAIVRLHLRQEIRSVQRRLGLTTIMVTHDQEEAMGVSDRVVVMSRGTIEQVGTPEAIYTAPATAFVAGFVGRSSHFEAVVDSPAGVLQLDGLRLPCERSNGMLFGTRVQGFVRPEDVRLGAEAAALPGHFEAEVTHLEFLGPVCRLSLEAGRLRLEADVAPDAVRALGAVPGAVLPAAFPAERILVFPIDE